MENQMENQFEKEFIIVNDERVEKSAYEKVNAEAEARALELTVMYRITIHPFIFPVGENGEDFAVAYVKNPTRQQIMALMSRQGMNYVFTGEIIFNENLLKDESHPCFHRPDDNPYYYGACVGAYTKMYKLANVITFDIFEKKNGK